MVNGDRKAENTTTRLRERVRETNRWSRRQID